jgi:hypothetical protein
MNLEQQAEKFKAQYGGGEFVMRPDGQVELPMWLAAMLLHLSGIRSKKRRIQKKVISREVARLIERALKK